MIHQTRLFILSALLLLWPVSPGQAQESAPHEHGAGEKLGQVRFPVSCTPATQAEFNRAVAMLHSFWYEKAADAFAEIARREPSCAMAYWGKAMTLYHPLWEKPGAEALKNGWAAVEQATAIGGKTGRENDYIAAVGAFYRDYQKLDHLTRVLAYEKAMEQLHSRYPDDQEAGVFYALALLSSAQTLATDKTYAREKKAAVLLNGVLAKEPGHPGVTHYLIHAYDFPPLAHLALKAARNYAKIAPSVPHALHMPSHIFTRLGLWQESIKSNLASKSAAERFAVQMHMDGVWDEQLHAMDYLMYAYLQSARDKEAKALLEEMYRIRKTSPENFKVAYAFAAMPARYALERRQWAEAANLKVYPADFPWASLPWAEALIYFARAVGAAHLGDVTAARQSLDTLTTLEHKLGDAKEHNQVVIQRLAATGWLAYAEGKKEEAKRLLREAADLEDATEKHPVTPGPVVPAREMLGDLLVQLAEYDQAIKEFETALAASPSRFGSLSGAAQAALASGDVKKARSLYAKLVAMCNPNEGERVELQKAREALRSN